MKIAVPLAKNVSAPLGITAAASTIDAGTQEKVHGSGNTNEEWGNEWYNENDSSSWKF